MDTKYKVIIVVVTLTAAFAAGRYTVPEKIKVETKVVEVEKKVTDIQKDTKKKTTVVETVKPDGSKQVTTVIDEDSSTDKKSQTDKDTTSDTTKVVESGTQKVTISALGGIDINKTVPVFGASITKPVLGPLTLGLFGLSSGVGGASVGLTF